MNILINISIIVNIFLILFFCSVFILSLKENSNPKLRAKLGTILALAMFLYLICFTILSVIGFITKNLIMAGLIFFVAMLFVIGRMVDYKSLKIFSAIQLLLFFFSLYVLIR